MVDVSCTKSFFFIQLRIDFNTFVITGPSTDVTANGYEVGGSTATGLLPAPGKKISSATQCLTDSFSLTGPAGSVPPVICGTVSGDHGKLIIEGLSKLNYIILTPNRHYLSSLIVQIFEQRN